MTIVVACASPEGIVLASDSRTTERYGSHRRVTSESAHKVFEAGGRIGVATYGDATIAHRTIRGLFDDWASGINSTGDLNDLAASLGTFFHERLAAATPPKRFRGVADLLPRRWPLGFLVVGYQGGVGEVLEVKVGAEKCDVSTTGLRTDTPSLVVYRGQTSALRRLIRGVDFDELRESRIAIPPEFEQRLQTLHYELIYPVTTQDAVELAYFLIETTIRMQRFSDGTLAGRSRDGKGPIPGCGGPVQALVIDPRGVEWVARNEVGVPPGPARPAVGPD